MIFDYRKLVKNGCIAKKYILKSFTQIGGSVYIIIQINKCLQISTLTPGERIY